MYSWTDEWMYSWIDEWADEWMDEWMDEHQNHPEVVRHLLNSHALVNAVDACKQTALHLATIHNSLKV